MPGLKKLQSIVKYENLGPPVPVEFDTARAPGCTVAACSCTVDGYWWYTSFADIFTEAAWDIFFGGRDVSFGDNKGSGERLRAVRGGL